jgi:GNAT superfamily N-acetyltransferase
VQREASQVVDIRPVRPEDLGRLEALLAGLDDRDRFRRWFTNAIDVHRAAAWAAHPQEQNAVGLVATAPGGELIGHAALVPIGDARAEVCFEVAGPWRHHGVAGRFLDKLESSAAERGYSAIVANVLAENRDMLAVLREHGRWRERPEGSVLVLELPIRRNHSSPVRR